MANKDRPAGLIPDRHYFGGLTRANAYRIADGLASNIFHHDPVKSTGTGKNINLAAAGNRLLGVFAGCSYIEPSGEIKFSPNWVSGTSIRTGSEVIAYVYDDPNILFRVQADEDIEAADLGSNADLVDNDGGNAATGVSAVELDSSTITTSAAQVKIIDIVRDDENDFGNFANALVLINEHELRGAMTGV